MTVKRLDNIGVFVEDLDAAIAFFRELGLTLEGRMRVEGNWVDDVVGLQGVRNEIAMMRTPDGHSRLELAKFHQPAALGNPRKEPVNTLGIRKLMFAVDDVEDTV